VAMRVTLWFGNMLHACLTGKDYLYLSLILNHFLFTRIRRMMKKLIELIALFLKLISKDNRDFVFPFTLPRFVLMLVILI
jgi:hypothetical protein